MDGFFTPEDQAKINELVTLCSSDKLLDDGVFEFKRRFAENRSMSAKLKTFYSILKEDFLHLEERLHDPKINYLGRRRNVKPVLSVKIIPPKSRSINLVEQQDYTNLDNLPIFAL